jgi:hypothetical protein
VVEVGRGFVPGQCLRKRGKGPEGLYCAQHAKILAAGRRVYVPEDREVTP